ncbi:phage tail protein [Hymenobacter sp. BT635]|uniref:Phage tail protein n=1 Tax=Hymenobacter nitidus TaxID=2880929 RepID=A0ABS8A9N8_9BACT|nr:phage tail protein [Hymenobacter nitidus]MCB2376437.1 phage tail protein [Hymenobacter nitidus]
MGIPSTHTTLASRQPRLASRRHWLKGLSALLGTSLLSAPAALLAAPAPAAPVPASALVGGEEYIGMVRMLADFVVPQGWVICDGRELPISQHPALFAIIGTTYGGDGTTTFALPDVSETMFPKPAAADTTLENAPTLPGCLIAIKIANAPASVSAGTDLRLLHHSRSRASRTA